MKQFALNYIASLKEALGKIPLDGLEAISRLMLEVYEKERSIFVMGNGGSGSTASHFACDMNKGVSFGLDKRFKVICLNDNIPIMLAYSNDLRYADVFAEQIKNFLNPDDAVIGISSSGNSENVLKAVEYAKTKGTKTIGLCGFDGGKLAGIVDVPVVVRTKDTQKVEDAHLVITHIIMQFLYKKLHP